jgi:hypothetical protein
MSESMTEADELEALRYLVCQLLLGIGEQRTKHGHLIGAHSVKLVRRARQHFDVGKSPRLLERLETLEAREALIRTVAERMIADGDDYVLDYGEKLLVLLNGPRSNEAAP